MDRGRGNSVFRWRGNPIGRWLRRPRRTVPVRVASEQLSVFVVRVRRDRFPETSDPRFSVPSRSSPVRSKHRSSHYRRVVVVVKQPLQHTVIIILNVLSAPASKRIFKSLRVLFSKTFQNRMRHSDWNL